MNPSSAEERLNVIRVLMERAAIYRRALAPVMFLLGTLGIAGAGMGMVLKIRSESGFTAYWMLLSLVAVMVAFFKIRAQALKEREPFWSPPTRRVAQALTPALFAGAAAGFLALAAEGESRVFQAAALPPLWMILYGCAMNAAAFFTARGLKLFGWVFIVCGCVVALVINRTGLGNGHLWMGLCFGGLHIAYGFYLRLTESRNPSA